MISRFVSKARKRSKIHRILRQSVHVMCGDHPCMITYCGYYLCSWHWRSNLSYNPKDITCKVCKRG